MKHLYLFLVINGFINVLKTEYVTIWNHNMNSNNGWTGHNNFGFELNSDKCVMSPCCCVTADNNGFSYIEKTTNITSYYSIQLQMNINAFDVQQSDSCTMWYNFDNTKNTKYAEWNQGKYRNITINFPKSTIATTIYIKLQVIRNHGTCYWDNVILRGIPLTNVSHINTNVSPFPNSTASMARVLFTRFVAILFITPCICGILIVIIRFMCKRIKKQYNGKTSFTSTDGINIEREMMEFISSLHLSETDSNINGLESTKQFEHHVLHMYSNTITNSTTTKSIVPFKHGCQYKGVPIPLMRSDSIEIPSKTDITVNSVSQILASIRTSEYGEIIHVEDSCRYDRLERMVNELGETMQTIVDANESEFSYTYPSIYYVTETNDDMETITETYSDCASMQVHITSHVNDQLQDPNTRRIERMETFL